MFCKQCGTTIQPGTRFCPACGAPTGLDVPAGGSVPQSAAPPPFSSGPKLVRPRSGRMVAGICAAFALAYGRDATLIRVLLVLVTVVTGFGPGVVAYLVCWIIIPEQPYGLPPASGSPVA